MNSSHLITLFGLLLCSLSLQATEKLNVVFILADDMSRDTWGAYGGQDCKTPNIDQLAKDGIRFDRAYCTVAMCAPFRQELYMSHWLFGCTPHVVCECLGAEIKVNSRSSWGWCTVDSGLCHFLRFVVFRFVFFVIVPVDFIFVLFCFSVLEDE